MREKAIEQRLVKLVRQSGGLCPKLVSPGMAGMPDRILLMPGGQMAFVEVKAPGEKPRMLQERRHAQLRDLGFRVFVLDEMRQIPGILREMGGIDVGTAENDGRGDDGGKPAAV